MRLKSFDPTPKVTQWEDQEDDPTVTEDQEDDPKVTQWEDQEDDQSKRRENPIYSFLRPLDTNKTSTPKRDNVIQTVEANKISTATKKRDNVNQTVEANKKSNINQDVDETEKVNQNQEDITKD